jgi:hypothetical protein
MTRSQKKGFSNTSIVVLVVAVLTLTLMATYGSQYIFDEKINPDSNELKDQKTEYEISKLDAEISRIRSETAGSLFSLKLIALFVTVGGAIGGYLVGQSRNTLARINFEDRKNVDEVYQSVVQELADDSPILRAAAAVKLGSILKSFPSEWNVSDARKDQLFQLTKQVLAAALSIESDEKVLKTLTINIVLHDPEPSSGLANVQGLDLSGAMAEDAYWANCNFEYADFYLAKLSRASFRRSDISGAQFREASLVNSVLADSICRKTNFKMADLRGASFADATLDRVIFENAKVHAASFTGAKFSNIPDCTVDISENGDGSNIIPVSEWIKNTKGELIE